MLSRDKSPPLYRPDPTFKEPFTIDTIFRLLDHIPFSPPFLIIIPAIVAIYSQKVHNTSLVPSEPSWAALRHVISTFKAEYKIFFYIVAFIAVKSVNRTLSRIAHNNGVSSTMPNTWMRAKRHCLTALPWCRDGLGQGDCRCHGRIEWYRQRNSRPARRKNKAPGRGSGPCSYELYASK